MNMGTQAPDGHQPVRARENWVPQPPPIDPALSGSVTIAPAGPFVAGSMQTITLTYRAGRYGIDDTGTLRVCFRFATDQGQPQTSDPAAANYVTVTASNDAVLDVRFDYKLNFRPYDRTLVIRVVKGYLRENDTITVVFGDRSGGSPGFRLQTFADPFYEFQVLADPIACGHYVRVPNQPTVAIVAGPLATWTAVLPTRRAPGETFSLGIRVEDRWGNPAPASATIQLSSAAPVRGLPPTLTLAPGLGSTRIEDLSVESPSVVEITIQDAEGRELAVSNPLVITQDDGLQRFWGDLHAQSAETIGSGSAHDYMAFARDVAFIDIVGHQGNDFQITPEFWGELNALMAQFNAPGRFVTIPGYEWSGNTGLGGDRNVFFRTEQGTIRRSSHALVPDRTDVGTDCVDARELFRDLAASGDDVICWAHCGGRYADIHYAHDVRLERAVEVHSSWGTFEWLLADAFEKGYRVGVVANSDGHKGRPGAEPPGASMFGALGGLTCFMAERLDRDSIFEAMKARHHYGTTGCRLDLDVRAALPPGSVVFRDDPSLPDASGESRDIAIMGDIVRSPGGTSQLSISVTAQSPIVALEIRDGTNVIETVRPTGGGTKGRRIAAIWSGAEYRGRFRQTVWDGELQVTGNSIISVRPINFYNPDKPPRIDGNRVSWTSVTTGNFAGVELLLSDAETGDLAVTTPNGSLRTKIAALTAEPVRVECGKLDRQLAAYRLPDDNACKTFALTRDIAIGGTTEKRILVALTLEDGHRAWSSPIYFLSGDA